MRAVLASAFGPAAAVLSLAPDHPRPQLDPGSGKMLLRVQACALSPGDWRTLHGDADLVRNPGFPFVPAFDVSGTVVEVDPRQARPQFQVGDEVVATWSGIALGGLAEYALAEPALAAAKPQKLSAVEGAALANSAGHALRISREKGRIRAGDRVLVLGGSGGVGTALLQFIKAAGASFVAATSTQEGLLKSLGADMVIDYTRQNWWEVEEFRRDKLDVVFDLAEGAPAWRRAKSSGVLKTGMRGGRFVAVTMMNPRQPFHHVGHMLGFLSGILWRWSWTRLACAFVPIHVPVLSGVDAATLEAVLAEAEAGSLRVVLDPSTPFPFNLDGVVRAFQLMDSMHAHGKVVVDLSA